MNTAEITAIVAVCGFVLSIVIQAISYGRLQQRAADASDGAKKATEKAEKASADLAAFREEAARHFVTDDMLTALERRIVESINRLGDRLDRAFDRFDAKKSS